MLPVGWNILGDEFIFQTSISPNLKPSRRTMLNIISSMYDPLGLVAPHILLGKLIFQVVLASNMIGIRLFLLNYVLNGVFG